VTGDPVFRRLAGLLLVWAVLPLPFLYIVMPPFWITAMAVGAALLARPGIRVRLSKTVQNLLGVVIVVLVIAAGGASVGPLRPLGHLLVLLASVRAFQVADRRSLVKMLPTVFLLWLASLTASTHVAVLVYFSLSAVLWWWVGMLLHLDAVSERVGAATSSVPRPSHAAAAAVLAMILAIPVFLIMPRLRTPWIAGRGGVQSVTGFSSRVELSGVGNIRLSQEEALVVRTSSGEPVKQTWMRLRGVAYERVTADSWAPRRPDAPAEQEDGRIRVRPGHWSRRDTAELEIILRRPKKYLFLPESTVALDSPVPVLADPAGGFVLAGSVDGPLRYTVLVSRGEPPRLRDPPNRRGRRFEPHPEVLDLAERITSGIVESNERATAIEGYLRRNFGYSLSGMARIGPDPMTWFLLRSREGHCEYFAGGMVVLLDALGVPARMVGGYSGGVKSSNGDEVVVREANAHTWVEVWLGPGRGWEVFDPTPAVGVPEFGNASRRRQLRDTWEWVQASWDRYVLTYGLGEQLELLGALGESLIGLVKGLRLRDLGVLGGMVLLVWLAASAIRRWRWAQPFVRRRLRRPPAAHAVELLRRRLERAGEKVPAGATVRWIGGAASSRWPQAADGVSDLVWRAERELYSGRVADRRAEVRELWGEVRRVTASRSRGKVADSR